MTWEAMTVPADRIPLGREQSFHLLIGVARKRGRSSRETRSVGKIKAFDKEEGVSHHMLLQRPCALALFWSDCSVADRPPGRFCACICCLSCSFPNQIDEHHTTFNKRHSLALCRYCGAQILQLRVGLVGCRADGLHFKVKALFSLMPGIST